MSVTLHTDVGDLKIEVFCDLVPKAAENFLALCASGRYDGSKFHRVQKGYVCQAGKPAKGKGPHYSIWGDYFANEVVDVLKFNRKGMVACANRGANTKTNNCQFFITFDEQPTLNSTTTIFGHVISGLNVLDDIEQVEVNAKFKPLEPLRIQSVTIHANPIANKE